jgi:hypothetical protein
MFAILTQQLCHTEHGKRLVSSVPFDDFRSELALLGRMYDGIPESGNALTFST